MKARRKRRSGPCRTPRRLRLPAGIAGTSMAFEAEVWSTLENDLFDETGGSARIAGVVLNIAIISHSRQWVIVCFRGKTGHDDCTAECLFLTQSGHWASPKHEG